MGSKRIAVEEFEKVFRAVSANTADPLVLVGGHAVNAWTLAYADRIGERLADLMPLTSSDLDLWATRNALIRLSEELQGKLRLSGPRELTEGTLVVDAVPNPLKIDVLRSVYGLGRRSDADTILLELCGFPIPVLVPHLLLQAKLANSMHLDQTTRQDVKHVKLLALVIREFLLDIVKSAAKGDERAALKPLQLTDSIAHSPDGVAFSAKYDLPLASLLPREEILASDLPKLKAFVNGQLKRAMNARAKGK